MEARRDLDCKSVAERRRKVPPMILKEQKKVTVKSLAKLKAKRNRIGGLQIQDLEDIEFLIAQVREKNKLVLGHNERKQRGIDLMLEILDARDQRDFVTADNLTQSFRLLDLTTGDNIY